MPKVKFELMTIEEVSGIIVFILEKWKKNI